MSALEAIRQRLGQESRQRTLILDRAGRSIVSVQFEDQPCVGARTVVTAGLSELPWHRLGQELMMSLWVGDTSVEFEGLLDFVASQLAEGRDPLARGDVIGPAGPLTPTTAMEALYVCQPSYFPDAVGSFSLSDGGIGALMWLIPIYSSEAQIVNRMGATYFEDMLVHEEPDLLSLGRPAVRAI